MPPLSWNVRRTCLALALVGIALGSVDASPVTDRGEEVPSVALTRIRTGHFVVQATANGMPLRMVVDTACPLTVIDEGTYRRLVAASPGIKPASGNARLRTLNGRTASAGYVPDLRVGPAALGGAQVAVTSLGFVLGSQFNGRSGADGILGADVLSRHGAVIDLKHGTLSLDTAQAQHRLVAERAAQDGSTAVAMSPTSGVHLAVPCIVQDDPGRLVVDTGSPYTVVDRSIVAPADLARPTRTSVMRTMTGITLVAWVSLQHWNIGDFPVTRARVAAGDFNGGIFTEYTRTGAQVVGLFGLEWLTYWGAVIDFGSRTIYLKHP